jgi:hypothetical protein
LAAIKTIMKKKIKGYVIELKETTGSVKLLSPYRSYLNEVSVGMGCKHEKQLENEELVQMIV